MFSDPLTNTVEDAGGANGAPSDCSKLTLHKEAVAVTKRVRKTLVRAARTTVKRSIEIDEAVTREQVVVERVPINRVVDEVPPVRQEGDVMIMPVVEEEVIVVRRLVLKEEVHLRRVQTTQRHTETVSIREQQLNVTRTEVED